MPYTMQHYINDVNANAFNWIGNWVEPYNQAYTRAWLSFKNVLDNQRKADELRASIALSVLSIGLGAGLGAAFGATALRSVASNAAISRISQTNSIRLMRAANWIGENPTRSFIMGEAWDTVAGLISDQAKSTMEGLAQTNPSASSFGEDDGIVRSLLREHVNDSAGAALDVANSINESDTITEERKNQIAGQLRSQPFMQAPRQNPQCMAANGRAQKDMELAMFMAVVLGKDRMETTTLTHTGDRIGSIVRPHRTVRTRDIPELPSSTRYPSPGQNQRIVYENVGSQVERRINQLFRERNYGERFFYGDMGRQEIAAAERTITRISQRYDLNRLGPSS